MENVKSADFHFPFSIFHLPFSIFIYG